MRILIVSQRYHPFVGGVETQTRLIANELATRHHVEIAAANFEVPRVHRRLDVLAENILVPEYEDFFDGNVRVNTLTPSGRQKFAMLPIAARTVPIVRRYFYSELSRFGYPWYRMAWMSRLRELVRKFDVVHSVAGGYLGWTAVEAAKAEGKPFACTPYVHPGQHGTDARSVSYYRNSDAVFALLETDKKILVELGVDPDSIHLSGVVPLLPESADPQGFRQRHNLGSAPVVLYVGRMVEYKGYDVVLQAARRVWQTIPDVRFIFIGPGGDPNSGEFQDASGRIHFLGKVSEQEKADALAACTILAMPSRFEILPAVYLEAWSYAKPVVGGVANGLRELVEGNGAGLIATQDADDVTAVLKRMLSNPEEARAMGLRGKELVRSRYTTDAVVHAIESVYEQISGGVQQEAILN
ncbi:MAG: glycosyltransferase family 4 protein [Rhodothermales bacterium]